MATKKAEQQVAAGVKTPAEFKSIESQLEELKAKYSEVPNCKTKEGYRDAKKAIQDLTKMRTGTDKARLAITDPLRKRVKDINDLAKSLVGEVEKLEQPIRDAKREVDQEIERKNEARKAKIREGIERDITIFIDTAVGLNHPEIMEMVNELRSIDVAIYGELEKEADDERQRVIGVLSTMAMDAMGKAVSSATSPRSSSSNVDMGSGTGRAAAPTLPADPGVEKDDSDVWDKAVDDLEAHAGLTKEQAENVLQAIVVGEIRGIEFKY